MSDPSRTSAALPAILSVGRALPGNYADQETLTAALRAHWARQHFNADRLEELHRAVKVKGRHLALPLAEYPPLDTFKKSNDAWIRVAEELGAEAVLRALDAAGLRPADVDQLVFVTVTGLATPSIDAKLVNRLGLRRDVKRVPIFGLGCVAGAAGLARALRSPAALPGRGRRCCSRWSSARSPCSARTSRSRTRWPRGSSATARRRWSSPVVHGR